jgi:tripartite-type tricarboxylate transporter receptor subunit TctC
MRALTLTEIILCGVAAMLTSAGAFSADTYPTRPVRIVTSEPGSSLDLAARVVAQGLTQSLGQQVIVDNRHVLQVETVVRASPDGYTLLAFGSSTWVAPMMSKLTYDAVKDLMPINYTVASPNVLVVHPKVAAKTVRELIAFAKANPGKLNYATSINGGTPHLAGEMFNLMAGVNIVRVPYKGVAPAVNELIAGQTDMMFPTFTSGMPHVKAGRLRVLAVTSAKPTALAPEIPTVASQGLEGYEIVAVHGIFAPAKTSQSLIARLNRDIGQYVTQAEVKQRFLNAGLEVINGGPSEFAAYIAADMKRMSKLVKEANIHAD